MTNDVPAALSNASTGLNYARDWLTDSLSASDAVTSHPEQLQLKTFKMGAKQDDEEGSFSTTYDPVVGLRTAGILGGFLTFIILYAVYKSRLQRSRWSAEDRQFIERYSRVLAEKWTGKRTARQVVRSDATDMRKSASQNTANWVQSQPLCETADQPHMALGLNAAVYHMCFDSVRAASYAVRTGSQLQVDGSGTRLDVATVEEQRERWRHGDAIEMQQLRSNTVDSDSHLSPEHITKQAPLSENTHALRKSETASARPATNNKLKQTHDSDVTDANATRDDVRLNCSVMTQAASALPQIVVVKPETREKEGDEPQAKSAFAPYKART